MSKNNYVMPPEILEVLGPPPLLASENPKRWNETLARYAQSYPPKDADDFEGWRNLWNLACDHWEEERMKRFKVEVLEAPRRAKLEQKFLALLWQIYSCRCSLQIHFRQCGHRCGGSRAKSSRMAWRTAGKVG